MFHGQRTSTNKHKLGGVTLGVISNMNLKLSEDLKYLDETKFEPFWTEWNLDTNNKN